MEYTVSKKHRDAVAALTGDARVKKALDFLKEDHERCVREQVTITKISSPTFHEEKRAAYMTEQFRALGLTDVHIDGAGNAVGVRKGKGGGPKVVVDGHMDTVYAEDTPLEPTFDGEFIHCPGIVDDTRALAAMLSLIRALDAAGVETDGDLVFTGTVRDNIRYGKLDATDDEVIRAAKLANAHNFITMLPNGYDTMLEGDGSGLSQGQRQLLSIARAAVADPPVMILDEATSSIDTRTELLVQKGMDGLMEGRTVFVIAHRLSTVQNSNVIMVLELGHIIERGTHEQLIEQGGTYYQLYTGTLKQSE